MHRLTYEEASSGIFCTLRQSEEIRTVQLILTILMRIFSFFSDVDGSKVKGEMSNETLLTVNATRDRRKKEIKKETDDLLEHLTLFTPKLKSTNNKQKGRKKIFRVISQFSSSPTS